MFRSFWPVTCARASPGLPSVTTDFSKFLNEVTIFDAHNGTASKAEVSATAATLQISKLHAVSANKHICSQSFLRRIFRDRASQVIASSLAQPEFFPLLQAKRRDPSERQYL